MRYARSQHAVGVFGCDAPYRTGRLRDRRRMRECRGKERHRRRRAGRSLPARWPATRFRFVRAHSADCGRIRRPQCMASAPAAKQAVLKPAPPYGNEILPCHDAGRALPGPPDTKKSLRKTPQACTIYHETHPDQAVAFSSFFMIEKMKSADTRHSTIRMLHSTHRGRPPHSMPMMATM